MLREIAKGVAGTLFFTGLQYMYMTTRNPKGNAEDPSGPPEKSGLVGIDSTQSSSNDDPSNASQTSRIHIDIEKLPRKQFISPLSTQAREVAQLRAAIIYRINLASAVLQRPVTQDEADALAYGVARVRSISSASVPIGLAVGSYRAFSTHESWRFPLYKPSDTFNPSKFLMIEGKNARRLWHLARGTAYCTVGVILASIIVGNYAATVVAVQDTRDPRLKDYFKALSRVKAHAASGRPGRPASVPARDAQPVQISIGEGSAGATVAGEAAAASGDGWGGARGDDGSPTAGFYDNNEDSSRWTGSEGGILSDQAMKAQETRQQASPRTSPTSNTASTFELGKVATQPGSFDDDYYDDASPTARQGASSRLPANGQGGSAWERIRSKAASSPPQPSRTVPTRRRPSPPPDSFPPSDDAPHESAWARRRSAALDGDKAAGATLGDSFTFSSTEEDRQLAKQMAQKEFDEMLERERRNG